MNFNFFSVINKKVLKLMFFVLLFLLSKINYAEKIDSLKNVLLTCTDIKTQAEIYNKIADSYLNFDIQIARKYADSALLLSIKADDSKTISNAFINIGNTHYYRGNLDSTLFYYEKSYIEILKSKDQNEIAASLNRLGLIYESKSNYKKASEYFLSAIKIFEKNKNNKGIADVYNNLGIINERFSYSDKSLIYYNKSLKLYSQINNKIGEANVLNNIASVYSEQNKQDAALDYLKKSAIIMTELNNLPQIATAYNNIGTVFLEKNNYDSAFFYMNKSLVINEKIGSKTGISNVYNEIAHVFMKKGENENALKYLLNSLEIRKEVGNLHNEFNTLLDISNTYKNLRKYDKALSFYEQYTELKDSVYTEKMQYAFSELQIKYETEKKDKEIQLLTKDSEFKQVFNVYLIAVIFALFLILVLFFYAFRAKSALLKKSKLLHEQQEEMSILDIEKQKAEKTLLEKEIKKQHEINVLQNEKHKSELEHKNRELITAAMHLLNKNKILSAIQKSLKEIRENSESDFKYESMKLINEINRNIHLDSDWEDFKLHFEKVNSGYFIRIQQKFPNLTNNDLKLCAYLKINLSSKEIAQMLNITLSGVNKKLYRLRKKIEIPNELNLKKFLSDF